MKFLMTLLYSLALVTSCGHAKNNDDKASHHEDGGCCDDDDSCPPEDCPCCEGDCTCADDCTMCDCGDGTCDDGTCCDDDCACDTGGDCTCGDDCGCCGDGACDTTKASASTVTPFSLKEMNAEGTPMFNSADHINTVFVVENYFLNCPYCNDNAPAVNDLAADLSNDFRIIVLDVGIDRNDSQYATWISRHSPNHPVLNDGSRSLSGQLGTSGYPSTYVLDCHLNVVYNTSGSWESGTKEEIEAKAREVAELPCF